MASAGVLFQQYAGKSSTPILSFLPLKRDVLNQSAQYSTAEVSAPFRLLERLTRRGFEFCRALLFSQSILNSA